jgi:hypothetical protein
MENPFGDLDAESYGDEPTTTVPQTNKPAGFKFVEYHKIDLSKNKRSLNQEQQGQEWLVLEKVHGANFCFYCDGKDHYTTAPINTSIHPSIHQYTHQYINTSIHPSTHQYIINTSSMHQCIINAASMHHQCCINASSMLHQCIINASSMHHQYITTSHHYNTRITPTHSTSRRKNYCMQ